MSKIDTIIKHLSPTSITLLRLLRASVEIDEWDARKTVQANRMDLLCLRDKKLTLTALGWKVACKL